MIKITEEVLKPFVASPKIRRALLAHLNHVIAFQVLGSKRLFGRLEYTDWTTNEKGIDANLPPTHMGSLVAVVELPKLSETDISQDTPETVPA